MKRILSIVLTLTLLLSLVSTAYAQKPDKPGTNIRAGTDIKGNTEQSTSRAKQEKKGTSLPIDKVPSAASNGIEKAAATKAVNQENQRVIVLFKEKVNKGAVEQAKGKINREYRNIPALAVEIPLVAVKGLEKNPNVASIEIDSIVKLSAQTQDWGIVRTEAPKAWELSYTGKGSKVSIVDTGISSHEDINISGGAAFTSYTTSYIDDNGHGTHVAGIIGARNNSVGTVGIAPDSSLYAVKVLAQDGSGYLSDVVAGIDWSITNKMDIINLSLGSASDSSTLKQVVDKAYSQGIIVVAAAGNTGTADGSGDNVNYPARYDAVIAVAATDSSDQKASFSSTGNTVEVAAPGVKVISTYLNNQYAYMSGTSMAAPYVAGNLALLKQAYPTLSNADLRKKLQETVIDLGSSGKDTWFGYGLIQAPKLQQAITEPEATEPQVLEARSYVFTDKSSYIAGEKVYIKAKVTDSEGKIIAGAQVKFTITPPRGKTLVSTGTTDGNGQITLVYSTKRNTVKGTYQVLAEAFYSNYKSSSASTTFQIK